LPIWLSQASLDVAQPTPQRVGRQNALTEFDTKTDGETHIICPLQMSFSEEKKMLA